MKYKDYAIYSYYSNGIYFGSADFYVNNDFKTLYSNLGVSYDITSYKV